MKALVTGAAGFVGRHMRRSLEADGWDVTAVDWKLGARCTLRDIVTDARAYFRTPASLLPRFDLVVHCAALVGGRQTIESQPLQLAAVDLQLDAALFEWLLKGGAQRAVYFSSSAAYPTWLQTGDPRYTAPMAESAITPFASEIGAPDQTYGWVKLTGERLAAEANRAGIPVHVFRPFSGYGSDQSRDYPFPSFIDRVKAGKGRTIVDPFEVWGDGTQVRDWVHIDDVVATVRAVVAADFREPVNICSGQGISFLDLAKTMCRHVGYEPIIQCRPDRPVGVRHRVGDPTLMSRFYKPTVSLGEGIARGILGR